MSKKVLTVDDDPDIIAFVKTVLEENSYSPLIARNGEVGLDLAREEKPDLVILDVLMPKQSGIRMYRELKADESLKDTPVIILSGIAKRTFLRSQEALTEFGDQPVPEPDLYIEKPVEPDELAEAIKNLIK
ncbi:MAG: response regulator [Deltaproteobacteria bacterium]|jgi:two-component system phosphate regulon response regulator PhoB|nr:response regulator [Deltaproteobacteria bacterium]